MESIEELKKSFIIDEENFEEKRLGELVRKINKICQVDKKGNVRFLKEDFSLKEKIKYILVARFLANKLESNIPKEVNNQEIGNILGISKEQVRARLSDLRKEKQNPMKDIDKSTHGIKPLFISKILEIESKNNVK